MFVFLTLFITSCKLYKIDNVHGISNLKNKLQLIKINYSNKNDIKSILGPSILINKTDNKWTYFEVRETKNKFGKKYVYVNDYADIFFNKYSIVNKIDFYDLNNRRKINFSKNKTTSYGVEDTFSKNLFNSTRKRMENARKKFDK